MVEGRDIGAPDRGVGVDDDAGHDDDAILFEEVCVFEKGVAHDLADGGADGVASEYLLECGAQDGAIGLESCDVETPQQTALSSCACGHNLRNFQSAVIEDRGV